MDTAVDSKAETMWGRPPSAVQPSKSRQVAGRLGNPDRRALELRRVPPSNVAFFATLGWGSSSHDVPLGTGYWVLFFRFRNLISY
jgi:hypothetical protein